MGIGQKVLYFRESLHEEPTPFPHYHTVIGFNQTEYEVVESTVSYEFLLGVMTGALAQNITLTIVPTPITAGRLLTLACAQQGL